MSEDETEEITLIFQKKKLPSILGKEDFVYWVKNRLKERYIERFQTQDHWHLTRRGFKNLFVVHTASHEKS